MNQPHSSSVAQHQEVRTDSDGDPFFLCTTPIVEPIFAIGHSHAFVREISDPLRKLEVFLKESTPETYRAAKEGAATLCQLFDETSSGVAHGGRAEIRKNYARLDLGTVSALGESDGDIEFMRKILGDGRNGRSSALNESIIAGVADLNESLASKVRRLYVRKGGLCDRLAASFEDLISFIRDVHASVGPITSRRFDGSAEARQIRKRFDPLIDEARKALKLIPDDRVVKQGFEQRIKHARERLDDFHFPDVIRALEGTVGDMREVKHIFLGLEGMEDRRADKTSLARHRRTARPGLIKA